MGVPLAVGITLLAAAVTIGSLLLMRRRAPEGGHFKDGDRAAGVFGVLATGLSILLGFVVFLAFTSYDNSRAGAEDEAILTAQQFETAQYLPDETRRRLGGEIQCYALSVVNVEWPAMEDGTLGTTINPWGVRMFLTLKDAQPEGTTEETAFAKMLDQVSDRETARNDRVHGAQGVVPPPLWLVLFLTASVIFVFILFFADREEHAVVQGVLAGSVAVVVSASLLLLWFLDNPFHGGFGSLQPTAMVRTLDLIGDARVALGDDAQLPCTEKGEPLGG
jgi:hypothetical protein